LPDKPLTISVFINIVGGNLIYALGDSPIPIAPIFHHTVTPREGGGPIVGARLRGNDNIGEARGALTNLLASFVFMNIAGCTSIFAIGDCQITFATVFQHIVTPLEGGDRSWVPACAGE
jgi:hypothetical protein